jgi:hypothetical protein
MRRGNVATLPRADAPDAADEDHEQQPDKTEVAVEQDGFNLHAGVRIEAGDDIGRERLCRYATRPPLSLERLRRLPGGRIAYRLKYVSRGRGKHRVMSGVEFMARLAAIIAPPRYPLLRYGGVLAPRSAWRRNIVPKARERRDRCDAAHAARVETSTTTTDRTTSKANDVRDTWPPRPSSSTERSTANASTTPMIQVAPSAVGAGTRPDPGDVIRLAPNIISVRHWDRLLGGLLYAVQPRVDWSTLLRRSFSVDVLECPRCHGRLRMIAVVTEREPVRRILAHLGCRPIRRPLRERATRQTMPTRQATKVSSPSAWHRVRAAPAAACGAGKLTARTGAGAPRCALETLNEDGDCSNSGTANGHYVDCAPYGAERIGDSQMSSQPGSGRVRKGAANLAQRLERASCKSRAA